MTHAQRLLWQDAIVINRGKIQKDYNRKVQESLNSKRDNPYFSQFMGEHIGCYWSMYDSKKALKSSFELLLRQRKFQSA